jgi:uncharacterized membrane protein
MSMKTDARLTRLEDRMLRLQDRLDRVEAKLAAEPEPAVAQPAAALSRPVPPPAPTRLPPPPAPPPRREFDLEELLGGRLLALAGGVTVIIGLVFLVALAVERGWLDERARTALAFAGSAALLGLGAWLHERRDRTQASLAACGTGLAGLFLSLTAATVLYDLVPVELALAGAFVFGSIGAALAIRWDATPIGGLGILGALAAPLLVGATDNAQALLFLAVAEAAAVAVLVWRRWNWLRVAAVALVLAQLAGWVFSADPSTTRAFVVLALFGVLDLAAATAFELRCKAGTGAASALIIVGNAAVLAFLGMWVAMDPFAEGPSRPWTATGWWLAGLGLGHVAAGLGLLRLQPRNRTIANCLFGVGLVALNLAFVALVSGVAIPIGWAAAAAALALPARSVTRSPRLVYVVVGAQILLAVTHVLAYDAPLEAVARGETASVWPILAIAGSAFLVARLTPSEELEWRAATDATALAAIAYGTAVLLDGVALVGVWAAEAAVLAVVGRRLGHRVVAAGTFGFLLVAGLHTLLFEAPPDALVRGADPFWKALVALGAVAAAAALAARCSIGLFQRDRTLLHTVAGTALVYLASLGIVSAFQPGAVDLRAGNLSVREQGQAILSAFWSVLGLGLLWTGLRRDRRPLRLAGFALLAVALGKVFLYDMAALDQGYRVLSFVVLGLLLLAGAYAYQRMRRAGPRVAGPTA